MLGHEYGAEMADRQVSLKDTTEAFIFFRTMVLDSAKPGVPGNKSWKSPTAFWSVSSSPTKTAPKLRQVTPK